MAHNFSINSSCNVDVIYIGNEKQPVMIVDNLLRSPEEVIAYAQTGVAFQKNLKDFYPGIRKPFSTDYSNNVCRELEHQLHKIFEFSEQSRLEALACVLSLATTKPEELRPIQSVPHIDSCDTTNIAVVHYLCQPHHGGTSFYRHRQTGYESINDSRLGDYAPKLKKEVMNEASTTFNYMNGDNNFFERTAQVDAKFNRAIFYRSNILHSGNVQAGSELSEDPRVGRLTANTLIVAKL